MKKVLIFLAVTILVIGIAGTAGAWTVTLGDAYNVTSGGKAYKAYDINFNGEETDYLDMLFVSLGFDTNDVSFAKMRTTPLNFVNADEEVVWMNYTVSPFTDSASQGLIYNIMGESPIDLPHAFFPVASGNTKIMTALFTTVAGGTFDDTSVYFTVGGYINPAANELTDINGEVLFNNYNTQEWYLTVTPDTIAPAPVPIPGAIWLLGSGILGLIGVRRKKA
jgi:hypothetical protein